MRFVRTSSTILYILYSIYYSTYYIANIYYIIVCTIYYIVYTIWYIRIEKKTQERLSKHIALAFHPYREQFLPFPKSLSDLLWGIDLFDGAMELRVPTIVVPPCLRYRFLYRRCLWRRRRNTTSPDHCVTPDANLDGVSLNKFNTLMKLRGGAMILWRRIGRHIEALRHSASPSRLI